jgi:polyphenol oxidase
VSATVFLRCPSLRERGFEHGFGTRRSVGRAIAASTTVNQVHGASLLRAPLASDDARADALWTDEPGRAVVVRTADCVPVLLADLAGRGVLAVHAGWRGSALAIAEHATRAFCAASRARPEDLIAVVGPHIGPCCYEIDAPVRDAIGDEPVFSESKRARPGHWMLDLFALNRLQLVRAGLAPARVLRVPGCTHCDTARFSSFRRDGRTGGMLHYIRMP